MRKLLVFCSVLVAMSVPSIASADFVGSGVKDSAGWFGGNVFGTMAKDVSAFGFGFSHSFFNGVVVQGVGYTRSTTSIVDLDDISGDNLSVWGGFYPTKGTNSPVGIYIGLQGAFAMYSSKDLDYLGWKMASLSRGVSVSLYRAVEVERDVFLIPNASASYSWSEVRLSGVGIGMIKEKDSGSSFRLGLTYAAKSSAGTFFRISGGVSFGGGSTITSVGVGMTFPKIDG